MRNKVYEAKGWVGVVTIKNNSWESSNFHLTQGCALHQQICCMAADAQQHVPLLLLPLLGSRPKAQLEKKTEKLCFLTSTEDQIFILLLYNYQ